LEDHLRDVEEGVGAPGDLNLAREGLDAPFLGEEGEIDFRKGRRGFSVRARLVTIE
jgi:hypothetical protein